MNAPTIRSIKRAISERHHISVRTIDGDRRLPRICRSRHMAMYLSRRLTKHSFRTIGKHFGGRHHTTVLNGYRIVQDRVAHNEKTRIALAAFIDELVQ